MLNRSTCYCCLFPNNELYLTETTDYTMRKTENRMQDPAYRQMEIAVGILIRNILDIRNVSEWAAFMGYSRSHFCRSFKKRFKENPKLVLRRARLRKVCRVIQSDWSATAYKVALESGFENDKALHKFLQRNFRKGFLSLKDELKRNAFRARKIISQAAESDYEYIIGTRQHGSDRPSFPRGSGI
jgi:AraC-like DNA-binding protein